MKFIFNETGDTREGYRFGGTLDIVAENSAEVLEMIDHFRLFRDINNPKTLTDRLKAIQSETLTHRIYSEKRPVYAVESCLGFEFTAPYKEWALRNFGYDGVFPDLTIERKWGGLIHTNYQSALYTQGEHICFEALTTSEPWNKKDAQSYAESRILDCIGEEFGTRYVEPEFKPARHGHFVRNPDYLKRHRATPGATNARLKRAFFQWWIENRANEKQKRIVEGNRQIVAETGDYMSAFKFERPESNIYYGRKLTDDGKTKDYKSMSFSDFAALS